MVGHLSCFLSRHDDHLGRKTHLVGGKEFFYGLLDFTGYLGLFFCGEFGELIAERVGGLRAHGPKLMRRDWRLHVELHDVFFHIARAGFSHNTCQFTRLSKTKSVWCVRIDNARIDMAIDDAGYDVTKRIDFAFVPDCQPKASARPGYAQHLTNSCNRIRKEHRAETAHSDIK